MKSRGFHLLLCVLVCSIVVLGCRRVGVGVFVYDLLQSMFVASNREVTILFVLVLCPYYWERDVLRLLQMFDASSCDNAFEFGTM